MMPNDALPLSAPSQQSLISSSEHAAETDEMRDTLRRLFLRVTSILQAQGCIVFLYDAQQKELVAQNNPDQSQHESLRLSSSKGLCGSAFVSRKPLIKNDLRDTSEKWLTDWEINSVIAFPLPSGPYGQQTPPGLLLVYNHQLQQFQESDLKVLSMMARQLSVVIGNASIYERFSEEKEQLQATLFSLGVAVVMVDVQGRISLINTAASKLLGPDTKMGAVYSDAIENEEVVQLLKNAIKTGRETQRELEIKVEGRAEPVIVQTQIALVRSQNLHFDRIIGAVAVFNDITEIRSVERLKTSFVSTVSHELRTPLTTIKGFVTTLLEDEQEYFDKESRREFYEIIGDECDRLKRLIDDLLSVSRIEAGRSLQMSYAEFVPLKVAIRVVRAHKAFAQGSKLMLEAPKNLPTMIGDEDKFAQILNNLLTNAIKYSPGGGVITLRLRSDEDKLFVEVQDQGIGIPEDRLDRIFQKFERVDNSDTRRAGGTGIGLYLVRTLVNQHGGKVWAESKLGEGSTFHLEFPLAPEDKDGK